MINYILILIYFIITSCAQNTQLVQHQPVEIAVVLPRNDSKYFTLVKQAMDEALTAVNVNITLYEYNNLDNNRINEIIQRIKATNTAIVLGSSNSKDTRTLINHLPPNIILFTWSNDRKLKKRTTNYVYVVGPDPNIQTHELIKYYIENGYKYFILLLPNSEYSYKLNSNIIDILTSYSALAHSEFYSSNSINDAVLKILNYVEKINEEEYDKKAVVYIAGKPPDISEILKTAQEYNIDNLATITGNNSINTEPHNTNISFLETTSFKHFMDNLSKNIGGIVGTALDKSIVNGYFSRAQFIEIVDNTYFDNIYFHDGIAYRKYKLVKRQNGNYFSE